MTPGCLVRDRLGRLGHLIEKRGDMGAVRSIRGPLVPGIKVADRLEVVPLADLTEVEGPVRLCVGDVSWEARAITVPRA